MLDTKCLCLLCCPGSTGYKIRRAVDMETVGDIDCGKGVQKFCGAQRHYKLKIGCALQKGT